MHEGNNDRMYQRCAAGYHAHVIAPLERFNLLPKGRNTEQTGAHVPPVCIHLRDSVVSHNRSILATSRSLEPVLPNLYSNGRLTGRHKIELLGPWPEPRMSREVDNPSFRTPLI
jgi:hypothetical protein